MATASSNVPDEFSDFISIFQGQMKDLDGVTAFAVDIGGSLAKLAYYAVHSHRLTSLKPGEMEGLYSIEDEEKEMGRLHLAVFETKYIGTCLDFIQQKIRSNSDSATHQHVHATGGGAHKFAHLFQEKLGLNLKKLDEMYCLCRGVNFLLQKIPNEAFTFRRSRHPQHHFRHVSQDIFPYLLVNIGSGVSILKVEDEKTYTRVDGSAVGGGTMWGLGSLLTSAKNFDGILDLAQKGNSKNVDMLVGDIYGGTAPTSLGLDADLLASSFGKAARSGDATESFDQSDIAKSLLYMISNNIGQVACLNARLHNVKHIYFGGFFIRGRPMTMDTITFAVDYWGKGEIEALFLRHEGYIGAVGALLAQQYDGDSSVPQTPPQSVPVRELQEASWAENFTHVQLELDHRPRVFAAFPLLLKPSHYRPDLCDLIEDNEARTYWLQNFRESVGKVAERAAKSEQESQSALFRSEAFHKTYLEHLSILEQVPSAYGELSVRSILDLREQCLREFHFADMYWIIKRDENKVALDFLPEFLRHLDAMEWEERQRGLIGGILAGNCFDWGAKATAERIEKGELDFLTEWRKLMAAPWAIDDFPVWLERLRKGPYKCVVVFVDNCGADIVLGVIPLVRELVRQGSKVIIAANTVPVLNDVTYQELDFLLTSVAEICPILRSAIENGMLILLRNLSVMQSGSSSACLDLLRGMGRAIHTNFSARFSCDCIKAAMLKNAWVAARLQLQLYDVVFRFEPAQPQA